eukprot:scaffold32379_cov30-Phaeocystis_antarctica.AAC.1
MTVARPHHACVPLSKRRQHRPVRSTCAAAPGRWRAILSAGMTSWAQGIAGTVCSGSVPSTVRRGQLRKVLCLFSSGAATATVTNHRDHAQP